MYTRGPDPTIVHAKSVRQRPCDEAAGKGGTCIVSKLYSFVSFLKVSLVCGESKTDVFHVSQQFTQASGNSAWSIDEET